MAILLAIAIAVLIQAAISLGLTLLQLAIAGPKPIRGQQLKNKTISSSAYGTPWPRCRGSVRLNGNMIWSTEIRTSGRKTTNGGIFGLGQQSIYTEIYSISSAVGFGTKLGGGSAYAFKRIYADGKLLWNARVTDASVTGQVGYNAASTGDQSIGLGTANGSFTLNIGDFIILAETPNQLYQCQNKLVLPPNSQGVMGIFPFAVQDYVGGGFTIPGLTEPLLHASSFDPDPHDGSHSHGGYQAGQGGINFYLGSTTQTPDPLMVQKLGAANSPGYRGLVYAFIFDWQLANYGNRPASITAEIDFDPPGTLFLSDVVASILNEAGYSPSEYDVSNLALTPIQGYEIDQENYQDSIRKLMALYVFDSAEIDGQIVFKFRDANIPAISIPTDHIGALADMHAEESRIVETVQDEQQIPATVWVRYYDSVKQFQIGSQYAKRLDPATNSRSQVTLDMPVTAIGDDMRKQAEKVLYGLWADREHGKLKLPPAYVQLDPTDVFEVDYQGDFVVVRISQADYGATGAIEIEGVAHDFHHSVAIGDGGDGSGGTPRLPPDTPPASLLTFLDVPFLDDRDAHSQGTTGLYVAVHTTLNPGAYIDPLVAFWHGAAIYRSLDNVDFALLARTNTAAFYGTATTVLAAPVTPWVFENSSLTVAWTGYDPVSVMGPSAVPVSSNDSSVQNSHDNLAALIKPDGNIELLQFVNVTDNGNGTFTFDRLVRGVRGTETMATGHNVGDIFVLLTGSSVHLDLALGDRGHSRYYAAISDGLTPDFTGATSTIAIPRDLMPYAPFNIGGYIDDHNNPGHENIVITWTRRSRLGGAWVDGTNGPLSEQYEEYQVEIYNGTMTSVLRTFTTPVQTVIYSASDQIADFGATQNQVNVRVYQISAVVGRGFPGIGVSPAAVGQPIWGTDPYAITFDLGDGIAPFLNQILLEHKIAGNVEGVIFPIGLADSVAGCRIAPANDYHVDVVWTPKPTIFDIDPDPITIATLTYQAGFTNGTFNLSVFGGTARDFAPASGELIQFIARDTDANISGLFWTVSGKRFTSQKGTVGDNPG